MKSKKIIIKDSELKTEFFEIANKNYEIQKEQREYLREQKMCNILTGVLISGVLIYAFVEVLCNYIH